ncbi:MAG: hypothetical protein IJR87_04180 [Bacteroidaceae bacterium]|nr:hypothetical protein [Bacteroidaceae bacterium]
MKRYARTLAILPILGIGMNAWADKTIADLTQVDGFYEIGSLEDMKAFHDAVAAGQTTLNARLTADLEGVTNDHSLTAYAGHFDGQGHVVTIDLKDTGEQGNGLFRTLYGGTVENLGVKGKIVSSNKYTATIVGDMTDGIIRNCWSTADIELAFVGDATSGGICGRIKIDNYGIVENCIFAGTINGAEAFKCAGMVGYLSRPGVQITNCVVMGTFNVADNDNNVFNRKPENAIYTNCYYLDTSAFATVSGDCKSVTKEQIESGELCFLLNGDQKNIAFYQTLGEDAFPVPNSSHAMVYSTASVNCDGTVLSTGIYTNDASQAGTVKEHEYENGFCTNCGQAQPDYMTAGEDGWFNIADGSQLAWFASYVNTGNFTVNARLTADIDMNEANANFRPIGNGGAYKATFDGQGHIISNLNVEGDQYVGLIGIVGGGAVIKNLVLDESCYISGTAFAGIIGGSNGEGTITMDKLGNEGTVKTKNQNAGGIIGVNMDSSASHIMSNCYASGKVQGGYESAALSGWTGGSQSSITNCWSTAEVSGNDNGAPFYRHNSTKTSNNYNTYGQQATKITEEDVTSGALCYMLNGKKFNDVTWYQTLDEDAHPVFDATHGIVYCFDDNYGCVVDGNVSELVEKLIASETSYVEDLVAQKSLKEAYIQEVEGLNGLTTLESVAAAYNTLLASKKTLQANANAYAAYINKVEETKAYLEENKSFSGPLRESLEAYLTGSEGPTEENPYGEAEYIIENELLSTEEITAEAARIDEWVTKAMSADAKPGQDVTIMLTNADFSNGYNGWKGSGGNTPSIAGVMPVAFTYNATSNRYQTVTGLKNGIYEVQMSACFFPIRSTETILNANHGASIYAGDNEVPIMVVREDALPQSKAQNGENCYIDNPGTMPYDLPFSFEDGGETYYVPSHETGAGYAFNGGRYLNRILVNVTDGTLTLGIRVTGTGAGADLTSYANTHLIYQGELGSETADASLDAVLAGMAARANTILNDYVPSDGSDFAQSPNFSTQLKNSLKAAVEKVGTTAEAQAKYELIQEFSAIFREIKECKNAYVNMYKQTRILNGLNVNGLLSDEEEEALIMAILEAETAYSEGNYTTEQAKEIPALKAQNIIPEVVDGYYEVGTPVQWEYFTYVLNSVNANSKGRLTADIDMSGKSLTIINLLRGEIDGQGHTLNILMNGTGGDGYAPIQDTRGCYIHDLNITGRIDGGSQRKITSLIGNNKENPFIIERVSTSITITSSYVGDSSISGFIADNRDVNGTSRFKDCVSTITIDAPQATNRGGLIGWNKSQVECENVLIATTEPEESASSATIIRTSSAELNSFKNCYYLVSQPNKQGTKVTREQLESGEVCYLLQADREEPVWFQTLGEDKTPVLLRDHKLIVKTANGYENAENAIHETEAQTPAGASESIYDLTGRRIEKPAAGIYIQNGRKILIK